MNKITNPFTASSLFLGLVGLVAVGSYALRASEPPAPTRADRSLAPVRALLSARPFLLERPAVHVWRAEQPAYDAGYLVVLQVDPTYVQPRQVEEPVLYAGAETVERMSHAAISGRVVGIVPCARGADGLPALDLAATTFFFGPEASPENIRAFEAQHELARAVRGGAQPFPAAEVADALALGGELMELASRDELDQMAGLLVLESAPEDLDVGIGILAPRPR